MGQIEIIHQAAVTGLEGRRLESLSFDGRYLYSLVAGEKLAVQLDDSGEVRRRYDTRRRYCALCCDRKDGGFWAVSRESPLYIFRLDSELEEYDRVRITGKVTAPPSLVALDEIKEQLVVRTDRYLLWLSRTGEVVNCLPAPSQTSDVSVFGRYLLTGGLHLAIYNEYLSFLEGFALPGALPITGTAVLCPLGDRLLCSVLGLRGGSYNTLLQVVLTPKSALFPAQEQILTAPGEGEGVLSDPTWELYHRLTPFFINGSEMLEHILLALVNPGSQKL